MRGAGAGRKSNTDSRGEGREGKKRMEGGGRAGEGGREGQEAREWMNAQRWRVRKVKIKVE